MTSETVHLAKRKLFDEWMEEDHLLVHVDTRHAGVIVPSDQKGNSALTLKLSYRFQGTTTADDHGISSYLKFSGDYFEVVIPWDALWGMTSASGVQKVWPESVPADLMKQAAIEKLKEMSGKIFGRSKVEEPKSPLARTNTEVEEDHDQEPKPKSPSGGAKIIPLRRK